MIKTKPFFSSSKDFVNNINKYGEIFQEKENDEIQLSDLKTFFMMPNPKTGEFQDGIDPY